MATQAFEVIRGQVVIGSGNTTATITETTDYTLPSGGDSTNCFIRLTNTRHSGMGNNSAGGNQTPANHGVWINNPGNIATSIQFERNGTTNTCHVAYEILCYVGSGGGDNEFIVRAVGTVAGTAAQLTGTTITTISDNADCVVFITGVGADTTSANNYEYMIWLASLVADVSDWDPQFDRAVSGTAVTVTMSYAVVEWIGSNWTVDRVSSTAEGSVWAVANNTSFVTAHSVTISDLAKAGVIESQYTMDQDPPGLDDAGDSSYLDSTSNMRVWMRTTSGIRTKVWWILQNSQADGTARNLKVQHFEYRDDAGGAEPREWTFDFTTDPDSEAQTTAALTAPLDESSAVCTSSVDGGGTAFPRGFIDYWISAANGLTFRESDTGQERRIAVELWEWPEDAASGTAYDQSVAGTLSFAGALAKTTEKPAAGTLTSSGALAKTTEKPAAGALSFAGAYSRTLTLVRAVGGALSFAGAVTGVKRVFQAVGGALSFAGAVAKATGKVTAGTLTSSGALAKKTAKVAFSGVLSFAGGLATTKFVSQAVGGALSFAGAIGRTTRKALSGVLSFAGAYSRTLTLARAVGGALSFGGALAKKTAKVAFSGVLSFAGAIASTKFVSQAVGGALSFAGALVKSTEKPLGGALSFGGTVVKKVARALAAILSFAGALGSSVIRAPSVIELTGGPWITDAADTFINIWVQVNAGATVAASVVVTGGPGVGTFSVVITANPFTGYIAVTGLSADTQYTYSLTVNGVAVAGSWTTRTMPKAGDPGRFRVIVEADTHITEGTSTTVVEGFYAALKALEKLLPPRPTISVYPGDYETPTTPEVLATRRTQMTTIRETKSSVGNWGEWRGRFPIHGTWDDWDYLGNNSAGQAMKAGERSAAETAWREFFAGHPTMAEANAIYRKFVVADVLFIFADSRTYREGTLGTLTPGEVNPWDYLTEDDAWGATQLAWIKSTLTAHKSKPIKILVTGCNLMDYTNTVGGPPTVARRDSIGIYHRRERNSLFEFLRDNPDEASGLLILKGDDHVNAAHLYDQFKPPEPVTDPAAPPNEAVEAERYANVVQVASSASWGTVLHAGWDGHPGERFFAQGSGNGPVALIIDIDTESQQKTMRLRWFATDSELFLYEARWVNGEWYFGPTPYRSSELGEESTEDATYTPDADPSSSWAAD